MSVDFFRHGDLVLVEMDLLVTLALDGLLAEVPHPRHVDVDRLAADVAGAYTGPVELDATAVRAWLRGLVALRGYLAHTLAVTDMGRADLDQMVGHLAAESPVATSARAFLWVGALLEDLARFVD